MSHCSRIGAGIALLGVMAFGALTPSVATPAQAQARSAADRLFIAGHFEQARTAYLAETDQNPDKIAPRLGLLRSLMRLDRWEEGLKTARNAVAAAPQDADVRGMLSLMLMRSGHPDEAASEAERARTLNPESYWTLVALGRIANWNHQPAEARAVYRRAVALHPDWPEARFYLVDTDDDDNTVTQADIDDVTAYLKLAPKGHPNDIAMEIIPSRLPMLRSFMGDPPFQASGPTTEAELKAAERGETADFTLTVPIERKDGYIVLPLMLNGQKFHLMFDTGGGDDITLYQKATDQLHLRLLARSTVFGVSGEEAAKIYKADTMQIGSQTYRSIPIESIANPIGSFDGIIGASVFNDYVVTLDLEHDRLTLMRGKTAAAPPSAAGNHLVTVPFHYLDSDILIPVTIGEKPVWAVVDTGADDNALFSLHLAHDIARGRPKGSYREGPINGKMGIGTSLTRQTMLIFTQPVPLRIDNSGGPAYKVDINPGIGASLMDTELSPSEDFQLDGLLGIPFMMIAERVTFDYPHRLLTLEIAK